MPSPGPGPRAQGCTGLHRAVQGCTGLHRAAQGCAGLHRAAQGCAGLRRAAPGCTGFHRAAQGCAELHRAAQGCTGLHRAAQGCTGLYRAAQGCAGLYRAEGDAGSSADAGRCDGGPHLRPRRCRPSAAAVAPAAEQAQVCQELVCSAQGARELERASGVGSARRRRREECLRKSCRVWLPRMRGGGPSVTNALLSISGRPQLDHCAPSVDRSVPGAPDTRPSWRRTIGATMRVFSVGTKGAHCVRRPAGFRRTGEQVLRRAGNMWSPRLRSPGQAAA